MSDNLYRLIQEEGKHLANSHDTEGAFRGVYLDDETNKPCGAGEFVKVDSSEYDLSDTTDSSGEEGVSPKTVFALVSLSWAMGTVSTKAYPHVKKFFLEKAFPAVKKFWNNKVKKKKTTTTEIITENSSEKSDLSFDVVRQEYRENMSSDEAKKKLVEAFVLQVIAAKKIDKVVKADIVDEDGQKTDIKALINVVTNPALLSEINSILSYNPHLITQQQVTELSLILGYDIICEEKYIPISSEILHDRLDELYI